MSKVKPRRSRRYPPLRLEVWVALVDRKMRRYVMSGENWKQRWCRLRGHPSGVRFYSPAGSEPDMHCNNCEEYIG